MTNEKTQEPYVPYVTREDIGRRPTLLHIDFPPYDWVKEVNSKDFVAHPDYTRERPPRGTRRGPVKLSKLMVMLEDALSRPEIVKVYTVHLRVAEESAEYIQAVNIRNYFHTYLRYKYGNTDSWDHCFAYPLYKITGGEWSGFDDEAFQEYLEKKIKVGRLVKDV